MTAYVVARLRNVRMGEGIEAYMRAVDDTFVEFGGRFAVHGTKVEVLEGTWPEDLVIVEFPDAERARAWYRSPAYQDILRLRTDNSDADLVLVPGVPPGYRAADFLDEPD
jgi:uncharacterized protein (DUF1330 family)